MSLVGYLRDCAYREKRRAAEVKTKKLKERHLIRAETFMQTSEIVQQFLNDVPEQEIFISTDDQKYV